MFNMSWKQIFWVAYLIIIAVLAVSAITKINSVKDVRTDKFYAHDLAMLLSEAGSVEGNYNIEYLKPEGLKPTKNGVVRVNNDEAVYLVGNKVPKVEIKGNKVIISG